MRFALLAFAVVLPARLAHANQCDAGRPLLANAQIPIGCPIRAYLPATGTPALQVVRGATAVDVTDTVTPAGPIDLPIHYDEPDPATCEARYYVEPLTYQAYDVTFTAEVGEILELDGAPYRSAEVVAAGPCPTPQTFDGSDWIQCSATVQEYDACRDGLGGDGDGDGDAPPAADDGGCAASHGASLAAPALVLGVIARRRRRR